MTEEYSDNEYEEDTSDPHMNQKSIKECCVEHGLYKIPDLNDVLHLECKMFPAIHGLKKYVNLKELWLNGNQITVIRGLDTLVNLTALHLHDNIISEITGLEHLSKLEFLSLSGNIIHHITGLEGCPHLRSLDLDRNRLGHPDSLKGLECCKELQILHLTKNGIEDPNAIKVFELLPALRVLNSDGNPIVRTLSHYRRVMISRLPNLTYLDDGPVSADEHKTVAAWIHGGKQEEMEERHKIKQEKDRKEWEEFKALSKIQREKVIAEGKDINDFPDLVVCSEDSERKIKQKNVKVKTEETRKVTIVEEKPAKMIEVESVSENIDFDGVD